MPLPCLRVAAASASLPGLMRRAPCPTAVLAVLDVLAVWLVVVVMAVVMVVVVPGVSLPVVSLPALRQWHVSVAAGRGAVARGRDSVPPGHLDHERGVAPEHAAA